MDIKSIEEAEKVLKSFIPKVAKYTGDDMSLTRMWPMLAAVGNPHQNLKVIHIAGTSGKTSTAYYMSALLVSAGHKVGLTVSPHVDSIKERLQINTQLLSDDEFSGLFDEFMGLTDFDALSPSYFELMIVFVYWALNRLGVDYAVIETGLGGLVDGSNVAQREDKVCIITDIGIDHVQVLGSDISGIAEQKAGIIHADNTVFMYSQSSSVMSSVRSRVNRVGAALHEFDQATVEASSQNDIAKLPSFQKRNWLLAKEAFQFIATRDSFDTGDSRGAMDVVVPGRMQQYERPDGSLLIMDGAHNKQKMNAFVSSFTEKYPGVKATILLSFKKGKEFEGAIDALSEIVSDLIITTFNTSQDMPAVSQDPEVVLRYCRTKGIYCSVETDNSKALELLLSSGSKMKIITGSFYLLSEIRSQL
ncbi:MAG: dihydrofolate synthase/folylpolyglutamate synthase [Candidatus Saccharimonadales bacterium]|jgi:dihydrofolate synthase/folylpolyglutamate synthase